MSNNALDVNKLTGNVENEELSNQRNVEIEKHQEMRKKTYDEKREKNELYQSLSHKMRKLHLSSAGIRSGPSLGADKLASKAINPIWIEFPAKCTKKITSVEELKNKLAYHTNSDEVFAVRYTQNNCTACGALDKVFEYLCYESKKHYPKLTFYEINKDETPELTKGMVRFPQIKAFAAGQWGDVDYKPPEAFREKLYRDVEREVKSLTKNGEVVTALQAEEMYFSAAGPSMLLVTEDSLTKFYASAQTRLHNYWKQVSVRRSWFFKKYVEPTLDEEVSDRIRTKSVLGEKIVYGPMLPPSEL